MNLAVVADKIDSKHSSCSTLNAEAIDLAQQIPIEHDTSFADLVNYHSTKDDHLFQAWFKYREGFSPALVERFMHGLPPGSVILDPFVGSGTTLTTAKMAGYKGIGIDINPLSILVSKVKTRNYQPTDVSILRKKLESFRDIDDNDAADPVPKLRIIEKVYPQDVLKVLLQLKYKIFKLKKDKYREFFFVAWLSILESLSNTFKEGNGIKYRSSKRAVGKYVTVDFDEWASNYYKSNRKKQVIDEFMSQADLMIEDVARSRGRYEPVVTEGTAVFLDKYIGVDTVDASIFSPPYLNCFNYFKIYKVELWMGGWIRDYGDVAFDKDKSLRSHVETPLKRENDLHIPYIEPYIERMDVSSLWDKRIPDAIRGYFIDMRAVFNGLLKVTKPKGKAVCVVGNSCYAGVVIPTDLILARIAEEMGFTARIIVTRSLPVAAQQARLLGEEKNLVRESILVLEKPDLNWHFSLPGTQKELVKIASIPGPEALDPEVTYLISNNGLRDGTHGFHKYAGKFIPHLSRWAIENYTHVGDTVFDPFVGSGTTLVESTLLRRQSIGGDIDPLSCLISKSKVARISDARLDKIIEEWNWYDSQCDWSTPIVGYVPKIENVSHWFSTECICHLSRLKSFIEMSRKEEEAIFLKVVFSSIIRKASNADDQSLKSYVSHTKTKVPPPARALFATTLADYIERLKEYNSRDPFTAQVINDFDAAEETLWPNQIKLIVTSPPYLKSIDYLYNQMLEYFWIGDTFNLDVPAKQNEFKKRYIGTEKGLKGYLIPEMTSSQPWGKVIALFSEGSDPAKIISRYFELMDGHIAIAKKKLVPGGHYAMVVGGSTICGMWIDTPSILTDIFIQHGFSRVCFWKYEIRNRHMRFPRKGRGGIIHDDHVIVFRKDE